jgi:hypothetical protein
MKEKRPPWSRGNVPTSWPEWRGFKPGGGRQIFKGRKNSGNKSSGRDFKPFDPCSIFTARKRTSGPKGASEQNYRPLPVQVHSFQFLRQMVPPFSGRWGEWHHRAARVWRLIWNSKGTYNRPYRGHGAWGNPPLKTIPYHSERDK